MNKEEFQKKVEDFNALGHYLESSLKVAGLIPEKGYVVGIHNARGSGYTIYYVDDLSSVNTLSYVPPSTLGFSESKKTHCSMAKKIESFKKNENSIRYVPLKEIRAWLRDPHIKAVDISDWSFSQCKELKNNHTLDTICISTGTYGPSGGVFEDENGTYYVCTHRGTGLTYLAP